MARVEKVHPGKDGLVRTATVKAQKGVFNRPVQRLHRLEIDAAAPQVTREADVPVDGGEKPRANSVNVKSVPIRKPKKRVVLPEGGQGGENVTPIVVLVLGSRIKINTKAQNTLFYIMFTLRRSQNYSQ